MEKEYINIEPIKVQEEDLRLVYINPIGESHNGSQKLEFIFSNNPDDCIGPQWEDTCDLGVYPPRKGFIKKVMEVTSKSIEFDCIVDCIICYYCWCVDSTKKKKINAKLK